MRNLRKSPATLLRALPKRPMSVHWSLNEPQQIRSHSFIKHTALSFVRGLSTLAPKASFVALLAGLIAQTVQAEPYQTYSHEINKTSEHKFVTGSGFENKSIGSFSYLSGSNGWKFASSGTGIVKDGNAFAATHDFPGNYSLFLQNNNSSATRTYNLPAGVWEFSFLGAQRFSGGSYQEQRVQVKVDGAIVFERQLDPGSIRTYFGKAFSHNGGNVTVQIKGMNSNGDNTAVVDSFHFNEVLDWNDSANWKDGNISTGINDSTLIPSGSRVFLSGNRNTGHLHIQGGLSFLNTGNSIHLQVRSILVDGVNARLQAGFEANPYDGDLLVSLLFGSPSENLQNFGTRFIGARLEGELSLHGKSVKNWVKLSNSSDTGSSQVYIPRNTGWAAGDEIIITATAGARNETSVDGWNQAEVRTISSIVNASDNRSLVTLNSPLSYPHYSENNTAQRTSAPTANWNYGVKGYVGLLSRNVTIRGAQISNGLGGHVMIMGAHNGMPTSGTANISNVEFYQMGQKGLLGRYPFHWHLLGDDGAGQYIKTAAFINPSTAQLRSMALTALRSLAMWPTITWDMVFSSKMVQKS